MRNILIGGWLAGILFIYGFSFDTVYNDCIAKPEIENCRSVAIIGGLGMSITWPTWLPLYISYRGWESTR